MAVDMSPNQLTGYTGSRACPVGFLPYWQRVRNTVTARHCEPVFEKLPYHNPLADYYRITLTAADGVILSAKYICPKTAGKHPAMLQFHDYPNASRSFFHLSRYIALGYAVLAPDARGQGGKSDGGKIGAGPTAYGPLFDGLEGPVEGMHLYHLYEDALLWGNAIQYLPATDSSAIFTYGEGQGAAMACACAAMYSCFKKCALHYPSLCDYKRVWAIDYEMNPTYEGLRFFCRWHDPLGQRTEEIFTKLDYVDALNFAPYIQAEVLMSTGLLDVASPPSAQYALYHRLSCPKSQLVYPKHGHELNNFFENELLKFIM